MNETEEMETGVMEVVSESDDSSDNEAALEERAKDLESQLSKYAYSYDAHVELVDIYKKLMNLAEMRTAYKRFSENFPLTSSLWLKWINDEIRIANTDEEKKNIIDLFEKAVEDYLSVDLWLEYVQFSIGCNDTEQTRKVFEKAINAAGLHVAKGSLIWDAYREFELAHLSCIADLDSELWLDQAKKVAEIFRRQISVSLVDMDRTFVEWRVWYERLHNKDFIDKEQYEWAYKKATKYLDEYKEFEDRLLSDEDKLLVYREYIKYEHKPEIIRCIYERAVADSSLDPEIWLEYCLYFFKLGNFQSALTTSERALRNCPWNEDLWIFNMRSLELADKSHDDITACLEKALTSGLQNSHQYLQLWMAYLEHYRRITDVQNTDSIEKLRAAFQKGVDHLSNHFGVDADPECTLLCLWARVEANFIKDMPAARKIWNDYGILNTHGSIANFWLEFVALEQKSGDEKHVRRTYQRALSTTKDWPQCIVQSWLMYERECGTAESMVNCMSACSKYMKKYETENPTSHSQNKRTPDKGMKRRHDTDNTYHKVKQGKIIKEHKVAVKKHNTKRETNEIEMNEEKDKPERIEISNEKQQKSIFISNLDYVVTEEELKEWLGASEELRLVMDRKGHSKGYAYAVLSTPEDVKKALSRDRERLNGRPVFISKCKMDRMQREHQFKYSTETEKHKLFVRGLPMSMTQEEVEALFKPYGELKEVRLVMYRNGRSKGLAYVEFVNSSDAGKAILATDNTDIQGYTISVAISAPPKRKQNEEAAPEIARHSKSRIQVPMLVPRSVLVVQTPKPPVPTLTNDDFRKMLLSEK